MICFEIWWNSADADAFRAKHEEHDGAEFKPVWDAAVRAMLDAAPAAPAVAQTEDEKVFHDALIYGVGFMRDGKHIPPQAVLMSAPAQAEQQRGELTPAAKAFLYPDVTIGVEQRQDDQYCKRCDGEGVVHTGISEASTTQCKTCNGTGIAEQQGDGGARVKAIQSLMLKWINTAPGEPAKDVWNEIEKELYALARGEFQVEPASACDPADICAGCRCKYNTYGQAEQQGDGEVEHPWWCSRSTKASAPCSCKSEQPSARVALSDEQIKEISEATFSKVAQMPDSEVNGDTWDQCFARAILATQTGLNHKPLRVERTSDMSVTLTFYSCRAASAFERDIAASTAQTGESK